MAKKVNNVNVVEINGKVTKVLVKSDKVTKFIIDNQKTSDKGNTIHTYASIIQFEKNEEVETGDTVKVVGTLSTSSYKGQFRTDVIADSVEID